MPIYKIGLYVFIGHHEPEFFTSAFEELQEIEDYEYGIKQMLKELPNNPDCSGYVETIKDMHGSTAIVVRLYTLDVVNLAHEVSHVLDKIYEIHEILKPDTEDKALLFEYVFSYIYSIFTEKY